MRARIALLLAAAVAVWSACGDGGSGPSEPGNVAGTWTFEAHDITAPGATGNVATEDVVYMLHGLGVETGIDLDRLLDAADFICGVLQRPTASRAGRALRARKCKQAA